MRPFYTFIKTFFTPAINIVYPAKVLDLHKYPLTDDFVCVSNHLRIIDLPLLVVYTPGFKRFLSKKENSEQGFKSWFYDSMGTIYIDRDKPELSSIRECVNTLNNGVTLGVFPEGTRNKADNTIQQIKGGVALVALRAKKNIVPIIIYEHEKAFHCDFMCVGDTVDLSEYYGKPINRGMLDEIDEKVYEAMKSTQERLVKSVEGGTIKSEIKAQKKLVREFRKNRKAAMKIKKRELKLQRKQKKAEAK